MKFSTIEQVHAFQKTVNDCTGNVILRSNAGDAFNLKSELSRYVAMAQLLSDHGEELELFCENKSDEQLFFQLFNEQPALLQ